MKKAIVSGIAGQDGALLSQRLLASGYSVVGLLPASRQSNLFRLDYLGILEQVTLSRIDLLDLAAMNALLEEYQPDEYYNLAALSSVSASFASPADHFEFNSRSVLNTLEAIRNASPHTRFYQASSSEMFGNIGGAHLPVHESILFHPVSPYGISKAAAHWLTVNYREAYGVHSCCGILFNHESALRPDNFVIKKIIKTALAIRNNQADELVLGNLEVVRDWGYAPSYVDAMYLMLQQDRMDDYLICSGNPVSLRTFVGEVFAKLDLDYKDYVRTDPKFVRRSELDIIYGSRMKAARELGWAYELTTKELIAKLLDDERELTAWRASRG